MKPPPRTLKRKRTFDQYEETPRKIVQSSTVESRQSEVLPIETRAMPIRDTTSETSGPTSANEAATTTSATGIDSDECKNAPANDRSSRPLSSANAISLNGIDNHAPVEIDRTAEIVNAYRNAMEILVEIANRNYYKPYNKQHVELNGPAARSIPLAHQPIHHHGFPHPHLAPNSHVAYYTVAGPTTYVTPYANPPAVASSHDVLSMKPSGRYEVQPPVLRSNWKEAAATITSERKESIADQEDVEIPKTNEVGKDFGDNVSLGMLDGFLALANGGTLQGQDEEDEPGPFAPPSPGETIDEALSRADDDIQALVDCIAEDLLNLKEPSRPVSHLDPYAVTYSIKSAKELGADLKRLIDVVQPQVNAVMPEEQIQVTHLFYKHLMNCIETRNASIAKPHVPGPPPVTQPVVHHHWSPHGFQPAQQVAPPANRYWVPPVQWPNNFTPPTPVHQAPFPPVSVFAAHGNIIAPPGVKDPILERKLTAIGLPPVSGTQPESQPATNQNKRKRKEKEKGKEQESEDG